MNRVLVAMCAACAACATVPEPALGGGLATELTMYRDLALVKQRVDVDVPASRVATARVAIPIAVPFTDVAVIDRGELAIHALRAVGRGPAFALAAPGAVEVEVEAPRAGRYAFTVAYTTDRIHWRAAYTVAMTPARDDAALHGAIAIDNTGGVALRGARVRVVDDKLAAVRQTDNAVVVARLTGAPAPITPAPVVRELGTLDVAPGQTRVALVDDPHRRVHAVLVYDPVGVGLDHDAPMPSLEEDLGLHESRSSKVSESVEIARTPADAGLPTGHVRVLERRRDGSLAMLAEGLMFEATARVATADTVPIGVADDVTGKRERRDFSVDEISHRAVEEFSIEVTNARATAVDVLVREHMYRGATWSIGFWNIAPPTTGDKEGQQQVALRTSVPAHGARRLYYVVVYRW
jgi:hypothetical protein